MTITSSSRLLLISSKRSRAVLPRMIATSSTGTRAIIVGSYWHQHDAAIVYSNPNSRRSMSTRPNPWNNNNNNANSAWRHNIADHNDDDRWKPSRRRQRQQPLQRQQQESMLYPRWKPSKYKSLIHLPATVSLRHPNDTNHNNNNNNNNNAFELECSDFAISQPATHNRGGGHVILGRNGSGKSLLYDFLSNPDMFAALPENSSDDDDDWKLLHPSRVASVSFESHVQLLKEQPHLKVHDAITGGSGKLSKAAQYLVVRFGLKSLLHRTVSTLSTGEIRKCLLVAALCQEPDVVLLENAFDGLDVHSRQELKSIVSKAMQGLASSGKLLVQQVNPESVHPTQILMSTHRPEEIANEIDTVSMILSEKQDQGDNKTKKKDQVITIKRPRELSQEQLMYMGLGVDRDHNKSKTNWAVLPPWKDEDPTLPTLEEIQSIWATTSRNNQNNNHNNNNNNNGAGEQQSSSPSSSLIQLDNVEIRRRRDGIPSLENNDDNGEESFATLLQPFSWEIEKGQCWLIAGGNGAGKSTLSRFLLSKELKDNNMIGQKNYNNNDNQGHNDDCTRDIISGNYHKDPNTVIGWVSTESHLGMVVVPSKNNDSDEDNFSTNHPSQMMKPTAWDVITHNHYHHTATTTNNRYNDGNHSGEIIPESVAENIVQWVFGGSDNNNNVISKLKYAALDEFSQGQQKLILLCSALALRPNLLILDEPTQGLDWMNRRRVLALLERICQANNDSKNFSLIYITHYQEEWIPSISHLLQLDQGYAVYQGPKEQQQQ